LSYRVLNPRRSDAPGVCFLYIRYPNVFNVERNDDGKQWLNSDNANAENQWPLDNRIVFRLRNLLHFSPAPVGAGEFCLITCPCHPPSILPTSPICSDRAA
jgi:hypothetical protein